MSILLSQLKPLRLQQGVALITVLLVLAIMVIIATYISSELQLEMNRTANIVNFNQAKWYTFAGEELAIRALKEDSKQRNNDKTHLKELWATKSPPFPVDGGRITVSIKDMQSCFNINALVKSSIQSTKVKRQFISLLGSLEINYDKARQVANAVIDWIDADTEVTFDNGAEDAYYSTLTPAYLPANTNMFHASELRAVVGITPAIYHKIRPYICAIPTNNLNININTVNVDQPEIFQAIFEGKLNKNQAISLLKQRKNDGYSSKSSFIKLAKKLANDNIKKITGITDRKSKYFQAKLIAEYSSAKLTMITLLKEVNGKFIPIRRQYGDDE